MPITLITLVMIAIVWMLVLHQPVAPDAEDDREGADDHEHAGDDDAELGRRDGHGLGVARHRLGLGQVAGGPTSATSGRAASMAWR